MANAKEWTSQYNPFNSAKLLAQTHRWKHIKKGDILPAPALVTVDPINACNYGCTWCNAEYILGKNTGKIDKDTLDDIADFLPYWSLKLGKENSGDIEKFHEKTGISKKLINDLYNVPAVCIAGGGEPLIHPYLGKFVERLSNNGIEVGIVTNGLYLDKHIDYLDKCTWVGVSVDCASQSTLEKLKKGQPGDFDRTIKGMKKLASLGGKLGEPGQGHGVSYKYLLHPMNVGEIYDAAKIAKEIGCRNLHIRPFGTPWDKMGKKDKDSFAYEDLEEFKEQIIKARELEDDTFKVFGVTHKFDGNFRKSNEFNTCHAIFMTGVFMPPTSKDGKFNFGVCCDRRGDDGLTLDNLVDTSQVSEFWSSEDHWKMFDKINVKKCPRCTYQPHNQIFEEAIEKDNMTIDFI